MKKDNSLYLVIGIIGLMIILNQAGLYYYETRTLKILETNQVTINEKMEDIKFMMILTERLQMYDEKIEKKVVVDGVYFPGKDYYCVWTGNRTYEDIQETECHEQCHDFVWKDYEHFCE